MKDIALHLRYESKRTDLPEDVIQTLSEAYAEISRLERERDQARREMSSAITRGRLDLESAMRRANELARCDSHPALGFKDMHSMQYATDRGWDCFEKENNNG